MRKTIDGTVVVNYLVDTNRDYAQVLEERDGNGNLLVRYVYGHDLISQTRGTDTSYYHYDGLGSTRALSNGSEIVTDTYTYDAFGNLLDKTGTTPNDHLFTGEFFDSNLGFYYLRARYLNPAIGRFVTLDSFAGRNRDPYSLHKYLYAHANPVNLTDPSGYDVDARSLMVSGTIIGALSGLYTYHVITPAEDRTFIGAMTWTTGGALVGGVLAYGACYLWLAPVATAEAAVLGNTTAHTAFKLYRDALQLYKGKDLLTKAGRALTKHPEVIEETKETLRKVLTTDPAINEAAKEVLKFIIRNGVRTLELSRSYGNVIQYMIPGSFGARWYADTGEFIGFIHYNVIH